MNAIGGVGLQAFPAQAKPRAYVVIEIDVVERRKMLACRGYLRKLHCIRGVVAIFGVGGVVNAQRVPFKGLRPPARAYWHKRLIKGSVLRITTKTPSRHGRFLDCCCANRPRPYSAGPTFPCCNY